MDIDLIKTSDSSGVVHVKYHLSKRPPGPEYTVTLPYQITADGMATFRLSQEALVDIINLIKRIDI